MVGAMARKHAETAAVEAPIQTPGLPPHAARLSKKGQELTPVEFWKQTKAYQRGAGTQYVLYRKYPVIDRKLSGETKVSIDIQPEMDEAYILAHWGTGKYTVYFNDQNGRPSCIANTVLKFDVDWNNPPILNQAELVEGPDNRGYIEQLKIRGLWKKEQAEMENNNGAATAAVQEIAGLAKGMIEQAQKPKVAEVAERSAIEIMGTAYKAAAATIAESRPVAPSGGGADVIAIMLKRMDQQHEMLMEVMKQKQNPTPAASIDSQLGVVDKVLAFAGRVGNQAAPSSFMDRLPDLLMSLLPTLMRGVAAGPAAPPMVAGPVAVAAPPAAPVSDEIDPAALQAMAQTTGLDPQTLQAFLRIGRAAIRSYQDGYSGLAFAEWVEKREGEEMYATLHAVGRDTILTTLRKLPAMLFGQAAAVVQSPEFEAWLDGFMEYGSEVEEGPEAPVAPKAPKGEAA
jgi:hypothetical protein